MKRPKVGVGVIIENEDGKILVGKRKGSHSPYYSIPGGHLELGESFEAAAIKEVKEETGIDINSPKVFSVCNNLGTYQKEGVHAVSINLHTNDYEGEPQIMEKDKCEGWQWCLPTELPQPHFEASTLAVKCYLDKTFYHKC
ncbi:MAG: NUDIX domain-containing protein [Saprospiraceae bacterium]|nr:NUDIX domain-containing protein [Bacteroidia bacterium]NNE15042.1 NUDIX domain-containing protein [Saprospiraceae bacterium]NNL91350.1 NUDIX domain-containing protein [Saprospiraceae bacterium]